MPSVTTITSYKPVTGLVNRTSKTAQKSTQRAKLGNIALPMQQLREMIKGQSYVTTDDNANIGRISCVEANEDGFCDPVISCDSKGYDYM